MFRRRGITRPVGASGPSDEVVRATENAWKIHQALTEWTGKVDAKASFALAAESAILAGVVTLAGDGRRLSNLQDVPEQLLFWAGLTSLVLAVILVVAVVTPQLRKQRLAHEWPANYIYFGHLKHWDSDQLASHLRTDDILPVLARQLTAMSAIAWTKHRRLQVSLALATLGSALVGTAALITG